MSFKAKLSLGVLALLLIVVVSVTTRLVTIEDGHLLWRTVEDAAEPFSKPYFHIGEFPVTPITLIKILLYLAFLGLLSRGVRILLDRHVLNRTSLDEGQKYNVERVTQYLVILTGIVVGLQTAGVSLASLAVFGGALGIGIGFGLQDTANNFISGIILLFERPVKVGDRIEVAGVDGQVMRIGARSTWVRTNDNIVIVLPNSDFISKPVINWTAAERRVRFLIPFGVSYKSDPDVVREVLMKVAVDNPDVMNDPPPDVIFTGFGDSSLDFELRVWTTTQIHRRPIIRSDLYFAIFRAFRQHGIEIPFPQRDLHLRSAEAPLLIRDQPPTQ